MNFFAELLKNIKGNIFKHTTIAVLGSSGAGKTTLLQFLETGEIQYDPPQTTVGLMYRKDPVAFDNWNFNVIDVGGQEIYKKNLWELAIENAEIIIYMIDACNKPGSSTTNLFQQDTERFNFVIDLLQDNQLLLILLNKQDLKDEKPFKKDDFIKSYQFKESRVVHEIIPTSVKFGEGIEDSFFWIITNLKQD